jgi:hypothetical protein
MYRPAQYVTIRPSAARLTHNVAYIRMDPYVIVCLGAETGETQTNINGGKTPYWHDTISLRKRNYDDWLKLFVHDRNVCSPIS